MLELLIKLTNICFKIIPLKKTGEGKMEYNCMYIMQFIFWFYIYYGYYVEVTVVPFIDTVSSLWILYLLVAKEKKKGKYKW